MRAIWLKPEHEPFRREIEETLVDELYARNGASLLAVALVLPLIWFAMSRALREAPFLPTLFLTEYAIIAFRSGVVVLAARRRGAFRDVRVRHRAFALGAYAMASGLSAIATVGVPHLDPAHLLIVMLGYTGILSTGVISMGSSPWVYSGYSAIILVPFLILSLLGQVETDGLLLAGMIFLYMLVLATVLRHDFTARRDNTYLRLKVAEMALVDPLTNTRNRRFLSEVMPLETEAVLRTRYNLDRPSMAALPLDVRPPSSMWFLIVDLDHFKRVNDTYGHEAGDAVLQQVSTILRETVRKQDTVVRWGGEEFVVVAPAGEDDSDGSILAERIRLNIGEADFILPAAEPIQVTCSVGFARYPFFAEAPSDVRWDEVLSIADVGLYRAKATGRDRAVGVVAGIESAPNISVAVDAIKHDLIDAVGKGWAEVVTRTESAMIKLPRV